MNRSSVVQWEKKGKNPKASGSRVKKYILRYLLGLWLEQITLASWIPYVAGTSALHSKSFARIIWDYMEFMKFRLCVQNYKKPYI